MEQTENSNKRLVLEYNPWLIRALMMVAGVGGLILILSTMNQYGFQSSYRFTYQVGAVFAVGGILSFLFFGWKSTAVFDLDDQILSLTEKKGVFTKRQLSIPLEQLSDVRLDRKTVSEKDRYRISVQINQQEWIPLSTRFGSDLVTYESSGRKVQGLIMDLQQLNLN